MSRSRRVVANLAIAAILAGSAAAIVTGRELWPFSPYPMFSALRRGPTVRDLWLYGVLPGGDETPLSDRSAFHPFRLAQLKAALERLAPPARREALEDMLARYEHRRIAGLHAGPGLVGLRVYRMTFECDDRAANRDRPLARELLAETLAEAR